MLGQVATLRDRVTSIEALHILENFDIAGRVGTAEWAALDMHAKGTPSVVRASPHYFNTEIEVEHCFADARIVTSSCRKNVSATPCESIWRCSTMRRSVARRRSHPGR